MLAKIHAKKVNFILKSITGFAFCAILGCSGEFGIENGIQSAENGTNNENTFVHDQDAYNTPDIVALENIDASGSVEKGPFLTGSAIKLYELHGSTLKQTGKSYVGKTKGEKGEFTISAATLNSQYAILEAMGYYKNEVTGHSSNSVLTLIAIVDFKNRRNANINLLTHLEFDRTLALIETGLNVTAAKKQSAFELFNAFYFGNIPEAPEDLSIIGETDGDAALLAVSVLLQGNRKEAAMSEVIANIGEDIAEDGTWDDFKLKTQIADWAFGADLAEIRKNVTDWNLGNVPNFEKYVIMFWTSVYGIKPCTADMEGVQQVINNEYSKYNKETFVCKDERWRKLVVVNEPETIVPNEKDDNKEEIKNDNGNDDKAEIVIIDGITYDYIKDSRDGNTYKVVKIGKQKWMAENLRYSTSLASTTCAGNNCETYGRLYEWKATKTDVCPEGWAVPTNSDWQELYAYVDANNGSESIETSLKSTQSWSVPGSNRFGFSAISAGYNWGGQSDFGSDAAWWSSSEDNHDQGLDWRLYNGANFDDLGMPKDVKFAIRCISTDGNVSFTDEDSNEKSSSSSLEDTLIESSSSIKEEHDCSNSDLYSQTYDMSNYIFQLVTIDPEAVENESIVLYFDGLWIVGNELAIYYLDNIEFDEKSISKASATLAYRQPIYPSKSCEFPSIGESPNHCDFNGSEDDPVDIIRTGLKWDGKHQNLLIIHQTGHTSQHVLHSKRSGKSLALGIPPSWAQDIFSTIEENETYLIPTTETSDLKPYYKENGGIFVTTKSQLVTGTKRCLVE